MSLKVRVRVVPAEPVEVDFTWYNLIRARVVRETVGRARRVLDVGCGRGDVLLALAGRIGRGTGIDVSRSEIARAERARKRRRIGNVSFRIADAVRIPFRSRSFDAVLCLGDVLSYPGLYGRTWRVLSEFRRVLRKGGLAVLEGMNWEWEYRNYPPRGSSFHRGEKGRYLLVRDERTAAGRAVYRSFDVVPGTPLHRWIARQKWPVSPHGDKTKLNVEELQPVPRKWLKPRGTTRERYFTPASLARACRAAGFRAAEAVPYGQTYDIAHEAGGLKRVRRLRARLARAEAEIVLRLRVGSGPWLLVQGHV